MVEIPLGLVWVREGGGLSQCAPRYNSQASLPTPTQPASLCLYPAATSERVVLCLNTYEKTTFQIKIIYIY